jgi:rod shape-determining protein MreC
MFQRRRARVLLAAFVVVALVLVTVDFRAAEPEDGIGGTLRGAAATVLGPVQDGLSVVVRPIANAAGSVTELFRLREENARLRAQLELMEERRLSYDDVVRENEQLRAQADMASRLDVETVQARIIAQGASNFEWTATINVGSDDGVVRDMAVVNGDGLVGRIIATTGSTSRVLLAVDPNFGAATRVAESGQVGVLSGNGNEPLVFEPLVTEAVIEVGQEVVTSSYSGGTFLPGLPVGTVAAADYEVGQLVRRVEVLPYVNFTALDLVSVVLSLPEDVDEPLELAPDPAFTPPAVDPVAPEEEPTIPPPVNPADDGGEEA